METMHKKKGSGIETKQFTIENLSAVRLRLFMCWCICSQYPDEALVQLGVGGLQVVELDGFAQQLLVKGQREAPVDVVTVKNCQAHHTTHKVEI